VRRLALALTLALAVVALAGCGNEGGASTQADTEGLYLAADGLKYQIQLSRQLNPALVEDSELLRGVPAAETKLKPDEVWFGVWLRVENDGKAPHASSDNFEITDTQDNHFEPLTIDPTQNALAYRARALAPADLYPETDSVAATCCPREGAMLLFKLNRAVYQNRPLEFDILTTNVPVRTEATVELDL